MFSRPRRASIQPEPLRSLAIGFSSLITLQMGRIKQTKTSEMHVAALKLQARSLKGGRGSCIPRMTEERWNNRHPRVFSLTIMFDQSYAR